MNLRSTPQQIKWQYKELGYTPVSLHWEEFFIQCFKIYRSREAGFFDDDISEEQKIAVIEIKLHLENMKHKRDGQ